MGLMSILSSCVRQQGVRYYMIQDEDEYPWVNYVEIGESFREDLVLKGELVLSSFRSADISTKGEVDTAFTLEQTNVRRGKTGLTYFIRGISLLSERVWEKETANNNSQFEWVSYPMEEGGYDMKAIINIRPKDGSTEEYDVWLSAWSGTIKKVSAVGGGTLLSFTQSEKLFSVRYSK